jgi:hypothetical protein
MLVAPLQKTGKPMTQTPKKPKKPLDYALRQMHDAMETVFDYDHDPCFVPNADQLVLFEMLHKQIAGYAAMSHIIIQTMRERANCMLSGSG